MNVNISLIKHWNSDSVLNPAFTAAAAHTHSGFYMDCRTNNNLRIGHQKTKVVSKQIQLRRRRVKRSHRRSPLIWSTTRLSPLWNCRSVWEEGRKEGGRRGRKEAGGEERREPDRADHRTAQTNRARGIEFWGSGGGSSRSCRELRCYHGAGSSGGTKATLQERRKEGGSPNWNRGAEDSSSLQGKMRKSSSYSRRNCVSSARFDVSRFSARIF